jgi:8-oxo-dGTP pyrophosphatase MutT (NUDIX family)
MLKEQLTSFLDLSLCDSEATYNRYLERLKHGNYTGDENPLDHFCVYFLPFNPQTKKVFITHHKKSGLWLTPGGHVDKDEGVLQALYREMREELGLVDFFPQPPKPFLFTVTDITNETQICRTHYDTWFLLPTDGSQFKIDPSEYFDALWLTIPEARKIITDPNNLKALEIIEKK